MLVFAALAVSPVRGTAQARSHPDSARLVTADIMRFWDVFDHAVTSDLEARFRDDYLAAGSAGLRAFAPTNIGRGFDLARQVYNERARYQAVRASTQRAAEAEPAIRTAFRRLDSLYVGALFTDVYFVIGRFVVGGYATRNELVIAAELYPDPAMLPAIVAHELIHFQQPPATPDQSLLARAFNEGSADFIGELISGGNINPAAQTYGRAHEHELWTDFKRDMHGNTFTPWMYDKPAGERPRDLGYFIGYRIAEAYYNRAADKRAALRDIIRAADVDALLSRSGYNP